LRGDAAGANFFQQMSTARGGARRWPIRQAVGEGDASTTRLRACAPRVVAGVADDRNPWRMSALNSPSTFSGRVVERRRKAPHAEFELSKRKGS